MSDNAFGGETDDKNQPDETPRPEVEVPDDASELLDGSLDDQPAPMEKPGSDSDFVGDVGDALPGGEQPPAPPADDDRPADGETVSRIDFLRLTAEYANYRRRAVTDKEAARAAGIGSVVEALLPVLDDIHAARQHGELTEGPMAKIAEKLEGILERKGVTRLGVEGEAFDPTHHEALMRMDDKLPEGATGPTVVLVMQPGYRIGDRLVRAARVGVAEPSETPAAPAPSVEETAPEKAAAEQAPEADEPPASAKDAPEGKPTDPAAQADAPRTDADGDGVDDGGFTPAPGCDAV